MGIAGVGVAVASGSGVAVGAKAIGVGVIDCPATEKGTLRGAPWCSCPPNDCAVR